MTVKSVFSYYITKNDILIPELTIKRRFGEYNIYIDAQTQFSNAETDTCECIVFGVAVNVITGESKDLAGVILEKCSCLQEVIEYEKQLGGKYILLYRSGEDYYVLGDATCSIPVFYNVDDDILCSSNMQYILNVKKYTPYSEYEKIRKSGDISQAMPYDITQYNEIKQLIPNHYLILNKSEVKRFINSESEQEPLSVPEATELVIPMIKNLVEHYSSLYKLYCPITAGRDSRVVLAFLLNSKKDFECYTMKHTEHKGDEQDLVVSKDLCEQNNVKHKLIEDLPLLAETKCTIDSLLGENLYCLRTLLLAQTVKSFYGDGAILTGDIIGQVGKCSLHRDILPMFATASYFRCKLHNFSKKSKFYLAQWLKEIKCSGENVNVFDLFSIENRMGRWAGQTSLIYNSIGQLSLNIFNSRSIIYIWTSVERRQRMKSLLHINLIESLYPDLLKTPFEKDSSFVIRLSKSNGFMYLLSSYLKFYIEKLKFIL